MGPPVAAPNLGPARRRRLGPDDDAPRQADEVGLGELRPRPFVPVVVKGFHPGGQKCGIEALAERVASRIPLAQIEESGVEGGRSIGPDNAVLVVEGLDKSADQAGDPDAVGAHVECCLLAVLLEHLGTQGLGVFVAEIEDVADLDPPPLVAPLFCHFAGEEGRVVLVVAAGVAAGEARHQVSDPLRVFVIHRQREDVSLQEGPVAPHAALAGLGEDDELMAQVAADGPVSASIGTARNPKREKVRR